MTDFPLACVLKHTDITFVPRRIDLDSRRLLIPESNEITQERWASFDEVEFIFVSTNHVSIVDDPGLALSAIERSEQIHKHGWNVSDAEYKNRELVMAAVSTLLMDTDIANRANAEPSSVLWRSNDWAETYFEKIAAKSRIGQLKVAAAFCMAEITRMLRENPDAKTN